MNRLFLLALLLATTALPIAAQTNRVLPPVDGEYRRGYQLLEQAERGPTPSQRLHGLTAARDAFERALANDPGHYPARALLAQTLFGLTRETPHPPQRAAFAAAAANEFAKAAALSDADWRIENAWGRFLTFTALHLASNNTTRCAELHTARQHFERAWGRSRTLLDKTTVRTTLGACLFELARCSAHPSEQRQLFTDCIDHFSAAYRDRPAFLDGDALEIWGRALLESARTDTNLLDLAAARLEEALGHPGIRPEAHYGLARCSAVRGQQDAALTHLRSALQTGRADELRERARHDADFTPLRAVPVFQALLQEPVTGRHNTLLREGRHQMELAGTTADGAEALALRRRAQASFAAAAEALPGSYPANLRWVEATLALAGMGTRADREAAWQAAVARCADISRLPEADWQIHFLWGELYRVAAEETDRAERYQQAVAQYETGLRLVAFQGDRLKLQRALALSLTGWGRTAGTITSLERADRLFDELTRETPAAERHAQTYRAWGETLLAWGRLSAGRHRYRAAVEKFLTGLELDPQDSASRYGLATAYAGLDQPERAMRHLAACLAGPAGTAWRGRAANDPGLEPLRQRPDFRQLLGVSPGKR